MTLNRICVQNMRMDILTRAKAVFNLYSSSWCFCVNWFVFGTPTSPVIHILLLLLSQCSNVYMSMKFAISVTLNSYYKFLVFHCLLYFYFQIVLDICFEHTVILVFQ